MLSESSPFEIVNEEGKPAKIVYTGKLQNYEKQEGNFSVVRDNPEKL